MGWTIQALLDFLNDLMSALQALRLWSRICIFSATPCGVFLLFLVWFSGVCVFFLVLCGLFFSVLVLCFFFPPYFVGFQLFGLIVAQEGQ